MSSERGILCGHGHRHPSVGDVRRCYAPTTPARVAAPSAPSRSTSAGTPYVRFTESEPTVSQLDTIRRLGGVVPDGCTRGQASSIIGKLYDSKRTAAALVLSTPRRSEPVVETVKKFPFPAQMLHSIRPGYYAVSPDGSDRLKFVRVSLIEPYKNGRRRMHQGAMKVQTQHGDDLIDRVLVHPDGAYIMRSAWPESRLVEMLTLIAMDSRTAAIRYGQTLGMCCRCGKTLTDERSRYYGIGPECERHWPDVINETDERRGVFTPSEIGSAL